MPNRTVCDLADGAEKRYNSGSRFTDFFSLLCTCQLDGPAVVTGIFTIPLAGHLSGSAERPNFTTRPLSEFVAGPENALAATALRPYLDRTATHASPLVLYGPHGSGKSHLAHGLAEWWRHHFPLQNTVCTSGAEFAQAYAAALDAHDLERWRAQIRGADLLILEDLGQLAAKRPAQLELQRVLDVLADREALVVVTAHAAGPFTRAAVGAAKPAFGRTGRAAGSARAGHAQGHTGKVGVGARLVAAQAGHELPGRRTRASVPALVSALLELELETRMSGTAIDQQRVRQFVAEAQREHAQPARHCLLDGPLFRFDFGAAEEPAATTAAGRRAGWPWFCRAT